MGGPRDGTSYCGVLGCLILRHQIMLIVYPKILPKGPGLPCNELSTTELTASDGAEKQAKPTTATKHHNYGQTSHALFLKKRRGAFQRVWWSKCALARRADTKARPHFVLSSKLADGQNDAKS